MFMHPSMLFEIDEFDTVFNALKFTKDGRGESIMEKLLRFYGASNGIYKMRKLSIRNNDGKKTDDDRKKDIYLQPYQDHKTHNYLL